MNSVDSPTPISNPRGLTRRSVLRGGLVVAAGLAGVDRLIAAPRPAYRGPNVVIVRFGGGVRRQETIEAERTYAPFFLHDLAPRGTLLTNVEITTDPNIDTSHGQGTLNILTGGYAPYKDVGGKFLGDRFETERPTLFEYLRHACDVPLHETLLINGEDRTDEEFYSFSNHERFGIDYRCSVLSLYRFKCFLLRRQIAEGRFDDEQLQTAQRDLAKLEALDHRDRGTAGQGPVIEEYWQRWRRRYGDSGLVNPRGDRLLTELTVSALRELRPRLMMINYNDPDYVHWGIAHHYTRGIAIIDQGLQRLKAAIDADPFYRERTILAIVPDCGRDDNRFIAVPYQHHFNSLSSRQIFALFVGPGIAPGRHVDRRVEQISVTSTIGRLMGVVTPVAEANAIDEVFA